MHLIPEEKMAAVNHALSEVFGVSEFEEIRPLTARPSSNLVCRVAVRGKPFLLRIVTRPSSIGAEREFACMKIAADAGLAPRIWYSSVEDRLTLTDYVEAVPFPAADALVRLPRMLRAMHALPAFPKGVPHLDTTPMFIMHKGPAAEGVFEKFRASNMLPPSDCEQLFAWHARLLAAYPRIEADMVSSHNDLFKPDNILYDGQRVWLVDWEASFLNNRYADLAVAANLVVTNEADEEVYLREYFGQPPDPYQRALFFLTQQIAHMFYTIGFLLLGSMAKYADRDDCVPEFADFQRRTWAGEIDLADSRMKIVYGRVHWERLARNMRGPRFEQALRIVS